MKQVRRLSLFLLFSLVLAVSALFPAQAAYDEALVQMVVNSYEWESSVEISQYNVTTDEMDILLEELLNSGKLPWYADSSFDLFYDPDSLKVLRFYPHFLDEEVYDYIRYEQRVQEVIADCVQEGMSSWQKALAVHDYLVASCRYDESYTLSTGYDLLVNGTAVCRGYAEAYMDIMNRLDIPCRIVSSGDMDHCWNLVNIDGAWYHVDVTWDDPSPDSYGLVNHTFFLVTDQEMQQDHLSRLESGDAGHYNWTTDIACTDTRFADAFWKEVESQICYSDPEHCYLRRTEDWDCNLYVRNELTGEETLLFTDEIEYIDLGQEHSYAYTHRGLSLWNGLLYFSSVDTVYAISPDGSDVATVYSHDPQTEGSFVYGSFVQNDTLYLSLADHDYTATETEIALSPTGYHAHNYIHSVVDATCAAAGSEIYACDCGIMVETEGQAALSHDFEQIILQEPTLWKKGLAKYCCRLCGKSYEAPVSRLSFWEWLLGLLGIR